MYVTVNLYSEKLGEVNKFLSLFYNTNLDLEKKLNWKKKYTNPVELAEIVGIFIDNYEDFILNMWIQLDKNLFIQITPENGNEVIKYLYERFPY